MGGGDYSYNAEIHVKRKKIYLNVVDTICHHIEHSVIARWERGQRLSRWRVYKCLARLFIDVQEWKRDQYIMWTLFIGEPYITILFTLHYLKGMRESACSFDISVYILPFDKYLCIRYIVKMITILMKNLSNTWVSVTSALESFRGTNSWPHGLTNTYSTIISKLWNDNFNSQCLNIYFC